MALNTDTTVVYIRLLREGTDVWRPTKAERIGTGLYRVLPTENYNPEDEAWEFPPGTIVRCEMTTLLDTRPHDELVAVERVSIMDQFVEINTQETMDEFLWLVDKFHDALLREVGIISRGYVTSGGGMFGDVAPSDARLVIHSQFPETPYIEIVCEELQSLRWEAGWDMDQAKGTVTSDGAKLGFGPYPEDYMVSAKKMSYRILGRERLGKEPRTVEPIVESEYE